VRLRVFFVSFVDNELTKMDSPRRSAHRAELRQTRGKIPLLTQPFRQPRNPFPPWEFLNPEQLERLHRASLTILENAGFSFQDAETLELWAKTGAKVDSAEQRVWLDGGLVMELVQKAPRSFTWRARNPERNVRVGENTLAFGPCGGMVYVRDLDRGRRLGTLRDLEDFIRVSHVCPQLHFAAWGQVEPNDLPVSVRHLHRLRSATQLTDKPLSEVAHGREIAHDCLNMARLIFGDIETGGPVIGDVINVSSPLRFDERMLGGLLTYARAGQVTYITPFILAGAMSPISMAAALAQQNAEALAGVALAQLARPGAPVAMGGFTTNTDMRSGSPAFGTPEGAWALMAGAQLARFYGLPYRGSGALTSANLPDSQAAGESLWTLWPAVMSHSHLIMHACGWLEGGLTASQEKYVLDLENLGMMQHFLTQLEVSDETLALDAIREVGPGGHHFGTAHTQARFATEFYATTTQDRLGYETWAAAGGWDAPTRAHHLWKELLAAYEPPALEASLKEALDDYVARRESELVGRNLYE
jgi:trimethylamine--corrinoid protein Co-methyltransferase